MMSPAAIYLMRVSTQLMHSVMGGISVFCFYFYAAIASHPLLLLVWAAKWRAIALVLLYCQTKYLPEP